MSGKPQSVNYPCPACGFEVFQSPPGSYELCPVCEWEDDSVQLRYPAMQGGANGKSLWEWQQGVLERIPVEVKQIDCLIRDAAWRLLTAEDSADLLGMPVSAREYLEAIEAEPASYYWLKPEV